jgi:hypothetical protein
VAGAGLIESRRHDLPRSAGFGMRRGDRGLGFASLGGAADTVEWGGLDGGGGRGFSEEISSSCGATQADYD